MSSYRHNGLRLKSGLAWVTLCVIFPSLNECLQDSMAYFQTDTFANKPLLKCHVDKEQETWGGELLSPNPLLPTGLRVNFGLTKFLHYRNHAKRIVLSTCGCVQNMQLIISLHLILVWSLWHADRPSYDVKTCLHFNTAVTFLHCSARMPPVDYTE